MIKIDLLGQKHGLLTVLKSVIGGWECQCDCGKLLIVEGYKITRGNTKSCGCLITRKRTPEECDKMGDDKRKYHPKIASARKVWRRYTDDGDSISFEKFLELSSMNCHYCGTEPSISYNYKKPHRQYREDGWFIYNSLDRVDSSKPHTEDNCVSCCLTCNRFKGVRSVNDFKEHLTKLNVKDLNAFDKSKTLEFSNNKNINSSMRKIYRHYHRQNLTLKEFHNLSQLPCFYCDVTESNCFNWAKSDKKSSMLAKAEGNYYYNGLDRIDSNKNHSFDNCVPCCKHCNFGKSNLSLSEFNEWILRVKAFNAEK